MVAWKLAFVSSLSLRPRSNTMFGACFPAGSAGFSDSDMMAIDQLIFSHSEIHRPFSIEFDGDILTFSTLQDLPDSPPGFPYEVPQ